MAHRCATELSTTVSRAAAMLWRIEPEEARARRAPAKWSVQEIPGHLIDSAVNNHQRFVRSQTSEDLRFEGDDQVDRVRVQDYQSRSWSELVTLREALNLHVANVSERTPRTVLSRHRLEHNLDAIAWETVPGTESATLEYLIVDYLGHLKHHLRQIDPELADEPARQQAEAR